MSNPTNKQQTPADSSSDINRPRQPNTLVILTDSEIATVRQLCADGWGQERIARHLGHGRRAVSRTIAQLENGQTKIGRQKSNPLRILTDSEIAIVRQMRAEGSGIIPIAKRLKCGRKVVYRTLVQIGAELFPPGSKPGPRGAYDPLPGRQKARDPMTEWEIGTLPRWHPLWEVDQQILRSKKNPEAPNPWRGSSSLDD